MQERVRSFVALELSDEARDSIARTLQELQRAAPQEVRWVDPKGTHLTIKFLGTVAYDTLGAIEGALQVATGVVAPFELGLGAPGTFPNVRAPRVLWVGITGNLDALHQLQSCVEDALAAVGIAREARPFRPHLTLGRVRETASEPALRRLSEALGQAVVTRVVWPVSEIALMRSTLTPQGAIYHRLARIRLRPDLSAPS